MADGKIYITISDTRGSGGGGEGAGTPRKQKLSKEEKARLKAEKEQNQFNQYLYNEFAGLMKSSANTIINASMYNITDFGGNYQAKRDIQAVKTIAGFGLEVLNAAKVGATFGAKGSAVAVGVLLAVKAVQTTASELTGYLENKKTNYAINQLRDLSGLNALNNGSRGTQ